MNYGLKPTQMQIIEFIKKNGPTTPRQIRTLLGCDIREASDRLKRLRTSGIVKNIGQPHRPEYKLKHRCQDKIKPAKPPRQIGQAQKIADECRRNWQGYGIHKIFGSAGK
ncbi:winged helix-turn-helix transcriptional regulator [Enterobacter sp. TMH.L2]